MLRTLARQDPGTVNAPRRHSRLHEKRKAAEQNEKPQLHRQGEVAVFQNLSLRRKFCRIAASALSPFGTARNVSGVRPGRSTLGLAAPSGIASFNVRLGPHSLLLFISLRTLELQVWCQRTTASALEVLSRWILLNRRMIFLRASCASRKLLGRLQLETYLFR